MLAVQLRCLYFFNGLSNRSHTIGTHVLSNAQTSLLSYRDWLKYWNFQFANIAKALMLVRLCRFAGWSAPLLLAYGIAGFPRTLLISPVINCCQSDFDTHYPGIFVSYKIASILPDNCFIRPFRYEDSHHKKQLTPRRRRPHYPPITPNACLKDGAASSAFDCMWQEVRDTSDDNVFILNVRTL